MEVNMNFKKIISLILTAIFMLSISSISVSAENISSAKELKPMQFISIKNTENSAKDYYFKISLKSYGGISFYFKSGVYNTKTTLNVLNKEGLVVANRFFSKNVKEGGCPIDKKGTYYLQITLQKGQSINNFGYYCNYTSEPDYISNSTQDTVFMIKGEKSDFNFLNTITKNKVKWKSLDKSIAKVSSNGIVTALKTGETRIFGYSDKDEYINVSLKIVNDTKKTGTVMIAGNEYKTNVKELDLQGLALTKSDMKKLSNFKNLETIYLMWCRIEDLSPLGKVTSLTNIGLGQSYISDISELRTLVNLDTLFLEGNEITNVEPLKNLKKLTSLNLMGNNIKDYTPLKYLTNLKDLNIYNAKGVPKDQIAVLKKALPKCEISY